MRPSNHTEKVTPPTFWEMPSSVSTTYVASNGSYTCHTSKFHKPSHSGMGGVQMWFTRITCLLVLWFVVAAQNMFLWLFKVGSAKAVTEQLCNHELSYSKLLFTIIWCSIHPLSVWSQQSSSMSNFNHDNLISLSVNTLWASWDFKRCIFQILVKT